MRSSSSPIRLRVLVCAVLVACSVSAHVAAGQNAGTGADLDRIRRLIAAELGPTGVPSVALAVVRDGAIVWEEGFGFADLERRITATARTPYDLASVAKAIAGTALTTLARTGRLDLDRPVNAYLGQSKVRSWLWDADAATVRRIANHTAGLTTYGRDCESPKCSTDETIKRYAVLVRPSGMSFDYSNLGYVILDDVIARVSGQNHHDFLRDTLFRPLGMTDCGVTMGSPSPKPAVRYHSGTKAPMPARPADSCSAHDLALLGLVMLKTPMATQKPVLPPAAIDEMLSAAIAAGQGLAYSLGWWVQDNYFGQRSVYASGGSTEALAVLRLIPSERMAVAVLANTGTALPERLVDEIYGEFLPRVREQRQQASAMSSAPKPRVFPPPVPALVGTWTGVVRTHQGDRPMVLSVTETGQVTAALGSDRPATFARGGASAAGVYGQMTGDLQVDDAPKPPYGLGIGLELRDGRLVGSATTRPRENQPGPSLSFWVQLARTSDAGPR